MSCSADDVKHLFVILSYLSALGMRLIVLALTALLLMPRSVSPVAVSLPSQMALKTCCSIFGSCLTVGSRYCAVSPNSQSGVLWSLFHLRKWLVLPSACVAYLLSRYAVCRNSHGTIGCLLVIVLS